MSYPPSGEFDRALRHLASRGWAIQSRDQWSATLVKPKKFSLFWFLVWLLTGPGCVIYFAYYLSKPAAAGIAYLQLGQDGAVYRNGKLWWRA